MYKSGSFEMVARAVNFSDAQPDTDAGHAVSVARLAEVAGLAKREPPDLVNKLRYKPSGDTYVAHRTAAGSMQVEADKEVLAKYGLSESVLEVFGQLLDQFDAAVKLGSDGRAAHTGATKRLGALAQEAGQIVRAMDARNRYRFKNDEQVLGAWVTASTVFGRTAGLGLAEPPAPAPTPVGEEGRPPEAGGDVRPAA
jgi:hypothetical protein